MALYTSRIFLKKRNNHSNKSPGVNKHKRNGFKTKYLQKFKQSRLGKLDFIKLGLIGLLLIFAVFILTLLKISNFVRDISNDLPSPEAPFGKKAAATEIYDRNGKLLYRVFADDDRDLVKISEVPELLKWTFLAAEDLQYYNHQGIDYKSIIRCALVTFTENQIRCGASTITQQLVKKTALSDKVDLERKVKEIILSLKIEQMRSKDEILEMYLNTIPEGSNVYGVKRAAQFYFGKKLEQLNLAEMSILASIPQNPGWLSPTRSFNPAVGREMLKVRQEYVLDQMHSNLEFINQGYREQTGKDDDLVTLEMIEAARNFETTYQSPLQKINAPHFVFYLLKLLQERGYKQGVPFTLEEIETQGLRIYSTLDLDMQKVAQEQVKKGVETSGNRFGAKNAAMIAMNPKNGEVLSMVGSYDYFADPYPENCKPGINCMFEPQVNVLDTLQSYGSSLKPFLYYYAITQGIISQNTIMADFPIKIGNYQPKNYEGGFIGYATARKMLVDSRNIPAITLVNYIGVDNFRNVLKQFGYTTLDNPTGYGPSIAVGGADIKMIEHAQAYAVLANSGKFALHEAVLKITDAEGKIIFEYKPEVKQIADPRAVYIVNDMLNGTKGGPGVSFDGRDIAGKTGTSEGQKETMYITYTPEIVVAAWLGNNNNQGMRYGASGFTSVRTWTADFVTRLAKKIPATPFNVPQGLVVTPAGEITYGGISVPRFVDNRIIIKPESLQITPKPNNRRNR